MNGFFCFISVLCACLHHQGPTGDDVHENDHVLGKRTPVEAEQFFHRATDAFDQEEQQYSADGACGKVPFGEHGLEANTLLFDKPACAEGDQLTGITEAVLHHFLRVYQ